MAPRYRIEGYSDIAGIENASVTNLVVTGELLSRSGKPWFDVRAFGAFGDNYHDDTEEIQAAIDAANAAGGGIVFFPPGTYKTTRLINGKSNVHLMGCGRGASKVVSVTTSVANDVFRLGYPGSSNLSNFGVRHLTIEAPTTVGYISPLYICGSNFSIHDVELVGGDYAGLFAPGYDPNTTSFNGHISNVYVHGVRHHPTLKIGGTGIWLFGPIQRITLANIVIDDVNGTGLFLDYGHLGAQPEGGFIGTIIATGIAITNHNQYANGAGDWGSAAAGVEIQGAVRCSIEARIFGGVNPLAVGLGFGQDQSGNTSDENRVQVEIKNAPSHAISFIGGNRNHVKAVVHDVGRLATGRLVRMVDGIQNSIIGNVNDNVVEVLHVQSSGTQDYTASFTVANGGEIKRNYILGKFPAGSSGVVVTSGSPTMTGADANRIWTPNLNPNSKIIGLPWGTAGDTILRRLAAGRLALWHESQAQELDLYHSDDEAGNSAYLKVGYENSFGAWTLRPVLAGTGSVGNLYVGAAGATGRVTIRTNDADRWEIDELGILKPKGTTNTLDIGQDPNFLPRDLRLGRNAIIGGNVQIGGGTAITKHLSATATWNPGTIADAANGSTTVTVTGAAVGDTVTVGFTTLTVANVLLFGAVTSADTVTVTARNQSGGNWTPGSGTLRVDVWKH